MKTFFYSAFISGVIFGSFAHAGHGTKAEVTGLVASFDSNSVKLYIHGEFVTVPKSAFAKDAKFVVGNEATAFVDMKREVASAKKAK